MSGDEARVLATGYGLLHISPRRWAVVRRRVLLDPKRVGYRTVVKRGGGQLGFELSDPIVLHGHAAYEIVDGCGSFTREVALRALHDLVEAATFPDP